MTYRPLLTRARERRASALGEPPARWTRPQQRLFDSPYKLTVFWGANGVGKSRGLGELAVRAIEGSLHWQDAGPQVVILAGNTWSQLGSTIRYMMQSRLRGWMRAGVRYEGRRDEGPEAPGLRHHRRPRKGR